MGDSLQRQQSISEQLWHWWPSVPMTTSVICWNSYGRLRRYQRGKISIEDRYVVKKTRDSKQIEDGQSVVACTWKPYQPSTPNNCEVALKRLHSLECRKFRRNVGPGLCLWQE